MTCQAATRLCLAPRHLETRIQPIPITSHPSTTGPITPPMPHGPRHPAIVSDLAFYISFSIANITSISLPSPPGSSRLVHLDALGVFHQVPHLTPGSSDHDRYLEYPGT
jgi:hypothetical protein